MEIIVTLFCFTLFIAVLVQSATMFSRRFNNKKKVQPSEGQSAKPSAKVSRAWIGYVAIALILTLWSIFAALFFLAIVWVMRQSPKPGSVFTIGNNDKSTTRRVYTWLFFSSLFTVPVFIALLFDSYSRASTTNQLVLTALVPLFLHLPLLLGLTSKSAFVYRHTQQGILLVALRAGVASLAVNIGEYPYEGLWLFLLGNGSLWLFGSIWGWTQVNRGVCWWMKHKGEIILTGEEETILPQNKPLIKLAPEKKLEYSNWYLKHERKDTAKEYAIEAFRHGNFEIRRQAVRLLDDLNEVEFF